MNVLRLLGHAFLWIGFCAGSYLAVQHVEVPDAKWHTVNWPWYGVAVCVGMMGVATLRVTARQGATHSAKLDADIQTLETSVRELLCRLEDLRGRRQDANVYEVHGQIDTWLMAPISDFVASRQTLVHTYGLQAYAQIMTDFSLAERNINRAWSASADGYVDEVWSSLARAERKLEAVAHSLLAWKSRSVNARVMGADHA
jgi:hypothetical protein